MFEIFLLVVIGVGLYRRRGGRWEWSRGRLRAALDGLLEEGGRVASHGRRSLPELYRQCLADVGSLVSDTLDLIEPRTRARLERRARSLAERARRAGGRRLGSVSAGGALAAGPAPGPAHSGGPARGGGPAADRARPAYDRLQRRYLEGAISLQQYVSEARRLRADEEPS